MCTTYGKRLGHGVSLTVSLALLGIFEHDNLVIVETCKVGWARPKDRWMRKNDLTIVAYRELTYLASQSQS